MKSGSPAACLAGVGRGCRTARGAAAAAVRTGREACRMSGGDYRTRRSIIGGFN
jgi:hypothetical protein